MDIAYITDFKVPVGPKGKIPWITLDGVDYSDSQFIMEMLMKRFSKDPDDSLTKEQKAVGLSMRVLFEDHIYWGLVHWRFIEDDMIGALSVYDHNCVVKFFFRRAIPRMKKALHGQGFGRHSTEEV